MVSIVHSALVCYINRNAKNGDANKHCAEGKEDVIICIDSVAQDQVGIFVNLALTFWYFEVQLLQQTLPQRELVITHLVSFLEASCQEASDVSWLHFISQWVRIFDVHQSFINLLTR